MSIIQSGLILNLDAGKTSSYPGTGTIWKDLSVNNNNGTLVNVPTFNSANGGSIVFDGNDDYVSVNDSPTINGTSQTISLWFKNTGIYTTGNKVSEILGKHDANGSYSGYGIVLSNGTGNTLLGCYVKNASVNYVPQFSSKIISSLNWYNVTITFTSDSQLTLYLNGSFESSISIGTLTTSNQPFRIGRSNDLYWNSYSGNIGQILIYNRALSPTEVLQNYDTTKGRLDTTAQIDCVISAEGTEVFPNSATTNFIVLNQSVCSEGEITDGITTGSTITKIGKDGVDKIIMTAIPRNGSTFKGWTQDKSKADSNTYYGSPTTLSYNATISDNTTWYALFDKDCSYVDVPFCFSIDKNKLCLSCEEEKTVYFDNKNNTYINNGITNNTDWYGSSTLETLITFTSVSTTNRVGWSFSTSSQESSGGGTFQEKYVFPYENSIGCDRDLVTKQIAIRCRPTNLTTPYFVFLYKNDIKIKIFKQTGNQEFQIPELEMRGNPNNKDNVYKFKYASYNNQPISFTLLTYTTWEHSLYGPLCNGGYTYYGSEVYTRATTTSVISPDGYYTQLINGQYSNYNIIYRVYEGQVIQVLDCRSDILDCNG